MLYGPALPLALLLRRRLNLRRQVAIAKLRVRYKVTLCDIVPAEKSAWVHIRVHGSDNGWVAMTGMTRLCVNELFKFAIEPHLPDLAQGGRPTRLLHLDYLCMFLYFMHTRSELNTIAFIFGCSLTTCNRQIKTKMGLVLRHLPRHPEAAISWPTNEQFQRFSDMIRNKVNKCQMEFDFSDGNPFAIVDGCDLHVKHATDLIEHDLNYNAKTGYPKVGNLFVWSPEGKVIYAYINAHGRMHDGEMALDLYDILLNPNLTPDGFIVVADQVSVHVSHHRLVCVDLIDNPCLCMSYSL